jgi:predicted DNA-binding ribbon-helix-helix protein
MKDERANTKRARSHDAVIAAPSLSGVNRTICLEGRRTTLRLEPELWAALDEVARQQRKSVSQLVAAACSSGRRGTSRASSVRVFIVEYYRGASHCIGQVRTMASGD